MLRSRTIINVDGTRVRLDYLAAAVRREAEGAEADLFDGATLVALAGVADALKAEVDTLAELGTRLGNLAQRALAQR